MTPHDPPQPNDPPTPGFNSPAVGEVLDAWIESGFASADCPQAWTPEGRRLANLLSLLDGPMVGGPALLGEHAGVSRNTLLVDVTLARILRQGQRDVAGRISSTPTMAILNSDDASELDSIITSGWSESPSDTKAAALLALLETDAELHQSADKDRLIAATLARVQSQSEKTTAPFRLSPVEFDSGRPRLTGRWRDLGAMAATILFAVGIFWPMAMASREQARQQMCSANLSRAGLGFTLYAGDHKGELPRARSSFNGGLWWDVGNQERSHSANLYTLVRYGYASLSDLACPGNPSSPVQQTDPRATDWRTPEEVSFSYQLFGPDRPTWNRGSRIVVLTDKSPVVQRSRLGEAPDPNAQSRNHTGHGQNILFSDGSVRFYDRPILENGDNIWVPGSTPFAPTRLTGRERPSSPDDAFVGP